MSAWCIAVRFELTGGRARRKRMKRKAENANELAGQGRICFLSAVFYYQGIRSPYLATKVVARYLVDPMYRLARVRISELTTRVARLTARKR